MIGAINIQFPLKTNALVTFSRKQFGLRKFLAVYNICMTILNTYIVYKLIGTAFKLNYSFVCEPPNVIPGDTEVKCWIKSERYFNKISFLIN